MNIGDIITLKEVVPHEHKGIYTSHWIGVELQILSIHLDLAEVKIVNSGGTNLPVGYMFYVYRSCFELLKPRVREKTGFGKFLELHGL